MTLLLPAGNASAWTGPTGTNTWLLRGRMPTLIDAGVGRPSHLDAVRQALGAQPLAQILVTHGHVDHAAGVPALLDRWPAARVRRHDGDDRLAADEQVAAGDGRLRALFTPGHAPDHWAFFDHDTGDLFCGDLLRRGGTVVIPASRGGNLAEYLASLRLLRDLAPKRLLPGHGPVIDDPAPLIAEYLRHRQERDEQIVGALAGGPCSLSQIVRAVYRDLPADFEAAAADTVLAHLVKLRDEGRVRDEGTAWSQAG